MDHRGRAVAARRLTTLLPHRSARGLAQLPDPFDFLFARMLQQSQDMERNMDAAMARLRFDWPTFATMSQPLGIHSAMFSPLVLAERLHQEAVSCAMQSFDEIERHMMAIRSPDAHIMLQAMHARMNMM
jgi:hypothetical protein